MCDMRQIHATGGSRADELISAAVRGLIAQRRINAGEVALAAGVSRAALYRKLQTVSPWQADEVDRLARFFRVSRDSLYEGRAEFTPGESAFGSEGWEFESLRARPSSFPSGRRDRRRRMGAIPLHLRLVSDEDRAVG